MCTVKIHGNGKISYSPNEFFCLDGITLVVQSEQFGSQEKLSWGSCRLK